MHLFSIGSILCDFAMLWNCRSSELPTLLRKEWRQFFFFVHLRPVAPGGCRTLARLKLAQALDLAKAPLVQLAAVQLAS